MEEEKPSFAVDRNAKWYGTLEMSTEKPQKLKLPYDPALPLFGIYHRI